MKVFQLCHVIAVSKILTFLITGKAITITMLFMLMLLLLMKLITMTVAIILKTLGFLLILTYTHWSEIWQHVFSRKFSM
jgi:hypothetical protein